MGMDSKGVPRVLRPLKFQPLVKLGQVLKMVKPLDRCLEETMLVGVLLQLVPLDKMLKATVLNNILSIPLLWKELPRLPKILKNLLMLQKPWPCPEFKKRPNKKNKK